MFCSSRMQFLGANKGKLQKQRHTRCKATAGVVYLGAKGSFKSNCKQNPKVKNKVKIASVRQIIEREVEEIKNTCGVEREAI